MDNKLTVKASEIEPVIDDGDGKTSFIVKLVDPVGYFRLDISEDGKPLYCELNKKENGFFSRSIKYKLTDPLIIFSLHESEYFDNVHNINQLEIDISKTDFDMEEMDYFLEYIFSRVS